MTSSEVREKDDFFQGRGESAAMVVAFVFGIFSILTLLQSIVIGSATWIILSVIYALLLLGTFFSFRAWAWNAVIADSFFKKSINALPPDGEIKKSIQNARTNPIMKILVPDFSSPDKADRLIGEIFIPVTGLLIPIAGAVLWVAIAFHWDVILK